MILFSIFLLYMYFRQLNSNDYDSNYIEVLSQLSFIDNKSITQDQWNQFIYQLNNNHQIYVLVDSNSNNIIASGTLLIENKIIHNISKVAHIEDIVTDSKFRGKGYGKIMIEYLIDKAKEHQVYKIILNCSDENIKFYEKCGFELKSNQMAKYF
jgi:glucosamine-phosphate N-acetyltransferase